MKQVICKCRAFELESNLATEIVGLLRTGNGYIVKLSIPIPPSVLTHYKPSVCTAAVPAPKEVEENIVLECKVLKPVIPLQNSLVEVSLGID